MEEENKFFKIILLCYSVSLIQVIKSLTRVINIGYKNEICFSCLDLTSTIYPSKLVKSSFLLFSIVFLLLYHL